MKGLYLPVSVFILFKTGSNKRCMGCAVSSGAVVFRFYW